jgi:hypothetical protein
MLDKNITFAQVMEEYEDLKPTHCEDYYHWRVLLNYINKNKARIQETYEKRGAVGAINLLWQAEDGEFVAGYFGEAYDNLNY